MQNDEPSTHLPPEHSPEQHPPPAPPSAAEQGFPAVLQVVFSGWQTPPLQVPLQQSSDEVQAALSAVQLPELAHTAWVVSQRRLQQSVLTAHAPLGPIQVATFVRPVAGPPVPPAPVTALLPPEPVLIAFTELPPHPPSTTRQSRAEVRAIVTSESLMGGQSRQLAKAAHAPSRIFLELELSHQRGLGALFLLG